MTRCPLGEASARSEKLAQVVIFHALSKRETRSLQEALDEAWPCLWAYCLQQLPALGAPRQLKSAKDP